MDPVGGMASSTERGHSIEINTGPAIINAVLFADDGKQVISSDAEGNVRWWRASDGNEVGEAIHTGAKISATALSPDGKWLVAGLHGSPSIVKVWNAETRQKLRDIKGHTDTVTCIDVSPDSTTLVTGSNDKYAKMWNIMTDKKPTWSSLWYDPPEESVWLDKPVVAVRFSSSGDRLAVATLHKSIRIYDSKGLKQLLDIPCPLSPDLSSPLSWFADNRQLYAASYTEIKVFDASSGPRMAKWSVPGGSPPGCISVSQNQKFIAVVSGRSVSFWDTATHRRIGSVVEVAGNIHCLALSKDCKSIAIGERHGRITIRSLYSILPRSFLPQDKSDSPPPTPLVSSPPSRFPLISVNDTVLDLWIRGELVKAEGLLTEQIQHLLDSSDIALAFAHRALVRCRLKQYDRALDDANKSIKRQPSVIGHIARSISNVYNGEYEMAMSEFDVVLADVVSKERHLVLLVKAIVLFGSGKHDGAIQRVDQLLEIVKDKSPYIAVQAHMLYSHGMKLMRNDDNKQAADLLGRAQEAIPFQSGPILTVIMLMFGWNFDMLARDIQAEAQKLIKPWEDLGDVALEANDPKKAIEHYSCVLSLRPPNPAGLFVKRSQVQARLGSWVEALKDAHDAIDADPQNPQAYAIKQQALHGLERFDEAIDAYTRMFSLTGDQDPRRENSVKISQFKAVIIGVIREVSNTCPIVLIDVKTGSLCDAQQRTEVFKSEPQFKELISSMALGLGDTYIYQVVLKYFEYVTFSHVWEGAEPSFQDVQTANSIWKLDEQSPLNRKLCSFCQVVRCTDRYRWAWSDTCCIDKTISTVLNESLTMMYRWYEASAATFAYLFDVDLESEPGHGLKDCKWMTRAWTNQELLAPKVIRFYDRNWKPYLGDTGANHKESPRILQELADAIHIPLETIKAFHPDNLGVREKLRIASTRNATRKEDVAYSQIGIFQSDIRPHYGEGADALGHLLEEIVSRHGDVTVLGWTGEPSSYNSCLPATLAVYKQLFPAMPALDDAEITRRVTALQTSVSDADALRVYREITQLPLARFSHRRLYLPCVILAVQSIRIQDFVGDRKHHYRASVDGIGDVEFHTSDRLPVQKPQKLVFVHPWISDIRGPADEPAWAGRNVPSNELSGSRPENETGGSLHPMRSVTAEETIRALRLLVRLQLPFRPLLLEKQQRRHDTFRRVATDHEIVMSKFDPSPSNLMKFTTGVVEIL